LLKITILFTREIFINMGRNKKINDEKKQSISIALKPELLEYYRGLHINLSSLVNKLLEDYKKNGNKSL
jgi:flavorubredoxin